MTDDYVCHPTTLSFIRGHQAQQCISSRSNAIRWPWSVRSAAIMWPMQNLFPLSFQRKIYCYKTKKIKHIKENEIILPKPKTMNFSFAFLFTVSGFINAVHGDTLKVLFNNGPDLYCGSSCCTPTEWDFIRQQADGVKRSQLRCGNDIDEENVVEIISHGRKLQNSTFSRPATYPSECVDICRGYVARKCPTPPCRGYRNRMLALDKGNGIWRNFIEA